MGWFGGSKEEITPSSGGNSYVSGDDSFSSGDMNAGGMGGMDDEIRMAAGSSGGAAGLAQMQQQLQQQMLIDTVMNRLTEMSFDKCITKPNISSLTSPL